jgi:hypothetical protein
VKLGDDAPPLPLRLGGEPRGRTGKCGVGFGLPVIQGTLAGVAGCNLQDRGRGVRLAIPRYLSLVVSSPPHPLLEAVQVSL